MYWQLRYAKNSLISSVPGYGRLRQFKRSFFPYDASLDAWTLEQGVQMLEMFRRTNVNVEGAVVLELGSGWKPVIPLLFRAAGAAQVILTDSERLLDARLLAETAKLLAREADGFSERLGVTTASVRSRLEVGGLRGLEQIAAQLGLRYLAPVDARKLPFEPGQINIVSSRAVLEHIPRQVLAEIFREFARLLLPKIGSMCHIVDNSDHWAHGDKRLSMLNFLRYSESTWKWFAKNPLDFMNRMRHSEYVALLVEAGFELAHDASSPDLKALQELKSLPISSSFRRFEPEDLAILTSQFVAVRA